MLEILKFIFSLCQEIAKVASNREKKRFKEMGKQLLLIYVYMNDVVVSASRVLQELERGIECVDSRMEMWGENYETAARICGLAQITRLTREHSIFLKRLWAEVSGFDFEFAVLDTDTHRKIRALLGLKLSVMSWLISNLESGRWPVAPNSEEFSEAFDKNPGLETIRKIDRNFIDSAPRRDNYESIKIYFEFGTPLQRIRELDQLRKDVKGLIEQHWNIVDLLPDIKHKYLKEK
jgi:hypothetical protein